MYKCHFWNTIFVKFAPVHVLGAHLLKMVDKAGDCLCCRQEKGRATFPWPPLQVVCISISNFLHSIQNIWINWFGHLELQCAEFHAGLSDCTWREKLFHLPKGWFYVGHSPLYISTKSLRFISWLIMIRLVRHQRLWEKDQIENWMLESLHLNGDEEWGEGECRAPGRSCPGAQDWKTHLWPPFELKPIHVWKCEHSLFTLPVL